MILLNFGHPFTDTQLEHITTLTDTPVERVLDLSPHFDPEQPFADQLATLMADIDLDSRTWQTEAILVNPPSFNIITAMLVAELHGRMGYFPPVVRLRLVEGAVPPRFEVAEIVNLQSLRDAARRQRGKG